MYVGAHLSKQEKKSLREMSCRTGIYLLISIFFSILEGTKPLIYISSWFDTRNYLRSEAEDYYNISALFMACNTFTVLSKVEFHR